MDKSGLQAVLGVDDDDDKASFEQEAKGICIMSEIMSKRQKKTRIDRMG